MTSLYYELADLLRAHAPDCGFIDMDKGQINNPELFDTLVPSTLISVADTAWDELTYGNQLGNGQMTIYYIFHLSSRTHADDPTVSASVESLKYADVVHAAIRKHPDVLRRTRTRRYPAPQLAPNVYIVEQSYLVREQYIKKPRTTTVRPPVVSATLIIPSRINNQS